jgi:Flp pilus assembly protein TadG
MKIIPNILNRSRRSEERGTSLVEMALLLPFLLLLLMVAVDFGRAYYMSIEVDNAARAAAQYGINSPTDLTGMQTAAANDASDISTLGGWQAVATSGCMCADGTGATQTPCNNTSPPTCGSQTRVVDFVNITTQVNYTPFFAIPGVISGFTIKGAATFLTGTS